MKYLTLFGLLLCFFAVLELSSSKQIFTKTRTQPVKKLKRPLTKKQIKKMKPTTDGIPLGKEKPHPLAGKTANIRPAIVGGTAVTDAKQFPWMVAMVVNNAWFCGGSVIKDNFVLTAAHCVLGATFAELYLGTSNRTNIMTRVTFTAKKFILHPKYNNAILSNDIALIELNTIISKNFFETGIILPIGLPPRSLENTTFVNNLVTVSGYGLTKDGGTVSNTLNVVSMNVISNLVCAKIYGTAVVTGSILCTNATTNGKVTNICGGDSGSSLHTLINSVAKQIGIVSFNARTCTGFPAGYTRVTSYLKFISDNTGIAIE